MTADDVIIEAATVAAVLIGIWWCVSVAAWSVHDRLGPQGRSIDHRTRIVRQLRFTFPGSRLIARGLMSVALPLTACSSSSDAPTLVWVDDAPPTTSVPTTTPPTTSVPTTTPPTTAPPTAMTPRDSDDSGPTDLIGPSTHEVRAGEHFWSIATDTLLERLGQTPTSRQVATYWRALIASNRASIVSGDPDVIHPGELLTLPPLTG